MMKLFRHKGVMKVLLWGVAGVIILSFGIMSNAYLLQDDSGKIKYAGKVFGKKVSIDDFEENYQYTIIQAQLQYGQNFNNVAPSLDLEQKTWQRIMLLEQANRNRIKVSNNEVVEAISKYPFFHNQNTNRFDQQIYQMVLRQGLRITTRAFEEGVRGDLKIKKLFDRETFTVSISDEEILNAYKQQNEKVRISYALFSADDFTNDVTFDEIQAKNYFLEHKRDFVRPAAINVRYIRFEFDQDNDDAKNDAYEKAYTTLNELRNGAELTEAAANNDIDIQESDFFDMEKPNVTLGWPLETFQQLFRMKPGQYAEIVTTQDSYDILQLTETRPPYYPPYKEVADKVKEAYLKNESLELSKEAAQNALPTFQQEQFNAAAKKLNVKVQQTPDFNFGQYLPGIGLSRDFHRAAFMLTAENPVSDIAYTEKGYAILNLDERLPIDMEKFEEEKDIFGQQLLMQKKMMTFNQFAANLQEKAELEDLISEYLKK